MSDTKQLAKELIKLRDLKILELSVYGKTTLIEEEVNEIINENLAKEKEVKK